MADLPTVNRRLIQGGNIIFPITSVDNIVNLKSRFAIVSPSQPQGQFVERQAWLDINCEQAENEQNNDNLSFGNLQETERLNFGEDNGQSLQFGDGHVSSEQQTEHLSFGNSQESANLTFEQGEEHNP